MQKRAIKLISDLQDHTYDDQLAVLRRSTFTKIPQAMWRHDNDLPTSIP